MKPSTKLGLSVAILTLLASQPALAYVGPGLGLGAIGAILGVILSVLLAIFAILWFPLKRLLGLGRKAGSPRPDSAGESIDGQSGR